MNGSMAESTSPTLAATAEAQPRLIRPTSSAVGRNHAMENRRQAMAYGIVPVRTVATVQPTITPSSAWLGTRKSQIRSPIPAARTLDAAETNIPRFEAEVIEVTEGTAIEVTSVPESKKHRIHQVSAYP